MPAHAATIQVTNTDDSGPGSLREALAQAQATDADDQITFAPSVTGTILLTSGELDVVVGASSGNLTIEGPGSDVLAVDAGGQSRVLDVQRSAAATPGRPWSSPGSPSPEARRSARAGGAATGADLTLDRVVISESRAMLGGGVSVEGGSLLVTASTITSNTAGSGAAAASRSTVAQAVGAELAVHDSTISDNRAVYTRWRHQRVRGRPP